MTPARARDGNGTRQDPGPERTRATSRPRHRRAPRSTRSSSAPARSAPPVEAGKRGRLIFALDATMSRQPTWDTACRLQAEMFREAAAIGGLDVQLVYFRGLNECRASRWVSDGAGLGDLMGRIHCVGGHTQIRKVLEPRARRDATRAKVAALVYVGDAMEEGDRRSRGRCGRAWAARRCRRSCSRRVTIRSPNRRSARSRG